MKNVPNSCRWPRKTPPRAAAALACGLLLAACDDRGTDPAPLSANAADSPAKPQRLLIIGQDLGAIRGSLGSNCCPRPDALTAYVDFYDLLKPGDFGGLGIDTSGQPIGLELDWNAGPVSAWKTASEFGIDGIAIGLSITENEHPGKLDGLVAGEFDAEIAQLAQFFSLIPGPVYLRIGYEFDGAWNEGYENAARYVHAWRRIVNTLREHDTNNVQFVWQAGAAVVDEVIDSKHEDIADWYPGDGYVDWMAFSWFMNPDETIGIPESAYDPPTPKELAGEVLRFARQHEKPVMIAEASPQAIDLARNFSADHSPISDGPASGRRVAMSDAGIWDHWYGPLFDLLNDHENIRALAYINANWDAQAMWGPPYSSGFWGDSRLETNEHIAKRFSDAIHEWRDEQQAAE